MSGRDGGIAADFDVIDMPRLEWIIRGASPPPARIRFSKNARQAPRGDLGYADQR